MNAPLTAEKIAELRAYMERGRHMGFPHASEEKILRLLDEVERSRALLKRIEWAGFTTCYDSEEMRQASGGVCPECEASKPGPHRLGCELAALRGPSSGVVLSSSEVEAIREYMNKAEEVCYGEGIGPAWPEAVAAKLGAKRPPWVR